MMTKIIITGGSGFVGSNTIKTLKEKGYEILNYDIKEGYDICNFEQVCSVIKEGDKILHLAAIARFTDADDNPELAWSTNVDGTDVIIRAKVPYIILRYAHLYGEGKLENGAIGGFISRMERGLAPILYGGKQSGDFTYVKDIVQANILALESDKLNETYNIGTGQELNIEEVYNQLRQFFHYDKEFERMPLRNFDPNRFVYDISKAKKMLN